MAEDKKLPAQSETVKRLRETFQPLVMKLKPHDEPATIYKPGPSGK